MFHSNDNSGPKTITRRKHKKSRVGCPQCKQKKAKCDETLPACYKCIERNIRCGYLDYTPREIELVMLAHWEAQGADPNTIPVQAQTFDPTTKVDIIHEKPKFKSIEITLPPRIDDQQPIQQSQQIQPIQVPPIIPAPPIQSQSIPVLPMQREPMQVQSIQSIPPSFNTSYNINQTPSYDPSNFNIPISQVPQPLLFPSLRNESRSVAPIPISIPSNQPMQPIQPIEHLQQIQYQEDYHYYQNEPSTSVDTYPLTESPIKDVSVIPLAKHIWTKPVLKFSEYATKAYFNETVSHFSIRYFIKSSIYEHLTIGTTYLLIFYGTILVAYGVFLSSHPELEDAFLIMRGKCISSLLQDLNDLTDETAGPLLRATANLDTASVYLKDKIGYTQHFKLSTGPSSLVYRVLQKPEKFPKSLPFIQTHADALLATTKAIWIPPYDTSVIFEFRDVVKEYGEKFIIQRNKKDIDNDYKSKNLEKQYNDLIGFLQFCLDMFENEEYSEGFLKYPLNKLYELFQRWYGAVPSECDIIDSPNFNAVEKVFYVFWLTLLELLKSTIISCRYIFSFFLDGFVGIRTFRLSDIMPAIENLKDSGFSSKDQDLIKWTLNYCCRIIAFFLRRSVMISANTILNEPIPIFLELKDRLNVKPLDMHETFITNFKETVIKKDHYPTESNNTEPAEDQNYFRSENNEEDKLAEHLNQLNTIDTKDSQHQTADLLNNVNPATSLLNNDYDPRFTDSAFSRPFVFQHADIDFIKRYITDRNIIVKTINNETDSDKEEGSEDD